MLVPLPLLQDLLLQTENAIHDNDDECPNNNAGAGEAVGFLNNSTSSSSSSSLSPEVVDGEEGGVIQNIGAVSAANRRSSSDQNRNERSSTLLAVAGNTRRHSREKSTSSKSKKKRKQANPLMDEDTVELLEVADKHSRHKVKELVRHHRAVERFQEGTMHIEERKLQLEEKKFDYMAWKGKSDELDYKTKLVREYKEMKESFSDKQILRLFPQMKEVVSAFRQTSDTSDDESE